MTEHHLSRPNIALPEHLSAADPLGRMAVRLEEKRFYYDAYRDYNEQGEVLHLGLAEQAHREVGISATSRVMAENKVDVHLSFADVYARGTKHYQEQAGDHAALRDNELEFTRQRLASFEARTRPRTIGGKEQHDPLRDHLNFYLKVWTPEPTKMAYESFVREEVRAGRRDTPDMTEWLANSGDTALLNFLQWHNHHAEEINNGRYTQGRIRKSRQQFQDKVHQAVENGSLVGVDHDVIAERTENIQVSIIDAFDEVMNNHNGYHVRGSNRIFLKDDYEKRTFDHEMVHAVIGWLPGRMFNEPMTEQVCLGLASGDFTTFNPANRKDKGSYSELRAFQDSELTAGTEPDLWDYKLRAFLAMGKGPEYNAYVAARKRSFGGVELEDYIEKESEYGREWAEENFPGFNTIELGLVNELYLARGVRLLGEFARGKTTEQIITDELAYQTADLAADGEKPEYWHDLVGQITSHVVRIRDYADQYMTSVSQPAE